MLFGRFLIFYGAVFAASAVLLGAFGAHLLEHNLTAKALSRYETAVEYQFYHALGIIASGILFRLSDDKTIRGMQAWVGLCFALGILLFSGSLYVYALSGLSSLGMVVPIGGVLFVCGWCLLAISGLRWK